MIGMLRGKVWEIQTERLVLDVQGVGSLLTVPGSFLGRLHAGQDLIVYTHVVQREDDLSLYGFTSLEEKTIFLELLSVSGIGPKAAIAILSTFGAAQIQAVIASEDFTLLTKVPGIGKKTAQRLILELKEKFKSHSSCVEPGDQTPSLTGADNEALETLLALGFGLDEARPALGRVLKEGGVLTTEEQVKKALRLMSGTVK